MRFASFTLLTFMLLPAGGILAAPVPRSAAEAAVKRFCNAVLSPNGFSYWDFEAQTRERMRPLISKRLLAAVDGVRDCGRDWAAHQPQGSTDKPPFVDCCVFSDSADWSPTSFAVKTSEALADGRRRVTVEYRYDSPKEHGRWQVAVYVVKEAGRYVVDDFEGGLDRPRSERWFVLDVPSDCKSGKWIAPY